MKPKTRKPKKFYQRPSFKRLPEAVRRLFLRYWMQTAEPCDRVEAV